MIAKYMLALAALIASLALLIAAFALVLHWSKTDVEPVTMMRTYH